jgi:hypothetical protein
LIEYVDLHKSFFTGRSRRFLVAALIIITLVAQGASSQAPAVTATITEGARAKKIATTLTVQIITISQGYGPLAYSVAGYLRTREGGVPTAGKTIYVTVRTAMGETKSYVCSTDASGYYRIPDTFTDRPKSAAAEFKGDANYEPSTGKTATSTTATVSTATSTTATSTIATSTTATVSTATSANANYIMFIDPTDGNKVKAKNGITGRIDYSGTDAAAVLQSAVDTLAGTGGFIFLSRGAYVWQSVCALPKNLPYWLTIAGESETIIQLTVKGPRAFDFRKTADYDTFANIRLENLTIDCNNAGGRHHVVLGTYIDGVHQTRINIEHIVIRNIVTKNVPVDPTMTNHRLNVFLVVWHNAAGEKQTNIRDILVENCDFRGGNQGVVIGGEGPNVTGIRVFVDGVYIHNCRHSLLSAQSSFFYSANFHIGQRAYGGYAHISDCYGEYSGDVGVEINNLNALVENVVIRDAFAVDYYYTNYNNLLLPNEQLVTFKSCTTKVISLASTVSSAGFTANTHLSVPLGFITLDNCEFHSEGTVKSKAVEFPPTSGFKRLDVRGFKVDIQSIAMSSGTTYFRPILIYPSGGTVRGTVSLRGIDVAVAGSRTGGTLSLIPICLYGTMDLDMDDITLDVDVTGVASGTVQGIGVGYYATASISGIIRNYRIKQITTDTNPTGIAVGGTDYLTIPTELRIENCDFSTLTQGVGLYFSAPSNSGKVTLLGNT